MKRKTAAVKKPAQRGWPLRLRSFLIGSLIVVGCLGLSTYVVVHWVERQVLTTDNWVSLVSPLPKQAVVSTALGNYVGEQVFAALPVQDKITDALPPKASFLAGPLTGQLKSLTVNTSQKIVASDGFQALWSGANRVAMNRLVTTARGQAPEPKQRLDEKFDINISGVREQLRSALGKASEAIPALQPAAQKAKAITVSTDLRARPRRIHQIVKTVDRLAVILPLLVAACFLGALALSQQRRRTAIKFTILLLFLMLIELIALKWLRQETLNQVKNPSNLSAVGYIYDTLVAWLKHMIYVVIAADVILYGLLLLSGPAKWARSARSYIHIDRLQNSRAMKYLHEGRNIVSQWEYYGWLGVGLLVLIGVTVLATVTTQAVVNALLVGLSLIALVHIIATPSYKKVK